MSDEPAPEGAANPDTAPDESPAEPISAAQLLMLATWFALLAGVGEVLVIALQRFGLQRFVLVGEQVVWMAPVANLLVFAVAALLLLGLRQLLPSARGLGPTCLLFIALALTAMALHNERLHPAAQLMLSAGIAVQVSRWLVARQAASLRVFARTLPLLAVAVVGAGVGVNASERSRERAAVAALPPAAPGAPDVIVIVLDTVRAESMSCYGYARKTTPAMTQLAARGARFDKALATSCWTLPSHCSMFTGRYPDELSSNWRDPLDGEFPLLAGELARRGYRTGGFVANFFYCNREMGLARGFHRYQDYAIDGGELLYNGSITRKLANTAAARAVFGHRYSLGYQRAHEINSAYLRWLDEGPEGRPTFAFLNYLDGHHPYYPPEPYASRFAGPDGARPDSSRWWFGGRFCHMVPHHERPIGPQELVAQVDAYDAAIAYLDDCIKDLVAALKARGRLDNTIIVITSDHGEHFGEHGIYNHGVSLHTQETHVPLILVGPGIPAGTVIKRPVSLRDLPATLMALTGKAQHPFPGHDLAVTWSAAGGEVSPVLSQFDQKSRLEAGKPSRSDALVVGGQHGIRTYKGREKLYDLERDPKQQRDLAREREHRPDLERWQRALKRVLEGDR